MPVRRDESASYEEAAADAGGFPFRVLRDDQNRRCERFLGDLLGRLRLRGGDSGAQRQEPCRRPTKREFAGCVHALSSGFMSVHECMDNGARRQGGGTEGRLERSQRSTVPSKLPLASVLPSREKASELTSSVCPVKVRICLPLRAFQSLTV